MEIKALKQTLNIQSVSPKKLKQKASLQQSDVIFQIPVRISSEDLDNIRETMNM